MIGLVEISVDDILKAYTLLIKDVELNSTQNQFKKRVDHLRDIIENSAGRKRKVFNILKNDTATYTKVHTLLEELVYASKLSVSNTMLVRVEMASLIQDILRHYNEIEGVKHEEANN
jgi:site-specific recombinase